MKPSLFAIAAAAVCLGSFVGAAADNLSIDKMEWMCGIHAGMLNSFSVEGIEELPDDYFRFLARANANWVALYVNMELGDTLDSTLEIELAPDARWRTWYDSEIRAFADKCHDLGLSVYLCLMITDGFKDVLTEGRDYVSRWGLGDPDLAKRRPDLGEDDWPWDPDFPGHAAFVSEFFDSYTQNAVHYAQLAQEAGIEMFGLGCETDNLFRTRASQSRSTEFGEELRDLVQAVRGSYRGLLTYNSHALTVPDSEYVRDLGLDVLWGDLELDVIGLSYYTSLSEAPGSGVPSVQSLKTAWGKRLDEIVAPLREMYPTAPIVFTEIGYQNHPGSSYENQIRGAANEFQDHDGNGLDDGEEEQAAILGALFEALDDRPGLVQGMFLWGNYISDDIDHRYGVMRYDSHYIRDTLAESIVSSGYGSRGCSCSTPVADGYTDSGESSAQAAMSIDWETMPRLYEWSATPDVEFDIEGRSASLSVATEWGKTGSHVSHLVGSLTDSGIAIEIAFHEGDSPGSYEYGVLLQTSGGLLGIYVSPSTGGATVALHIPAVGSLGWLDPENVQIGDAIRVVVPFDMLDSHLTRAQIQGARTMLILTRGDPEERFEFQPTNARIY